MKRLPPLRLLTTFSAVARLGTIRDAAIELNVTQPAISQSLKALEEHIGVTLLDRNRKPAQLTGQGQILAQNIQTNLGNIENAIEDIRLKAQANERSITVSCTLGMATHWLMPRLQDFYINNPDILINVQAPRNDMPVFHSDIDVALRYGEGTWRDGKTYKLFQEKICPVGLPTLIAHHVEQATALKDMPIIHVKSTQFNHWAEWPDYFRFRELEIPTSPGLVFDNYVQAVQAALNGRGLILGWRSITGDLVSKGTLRSWPKGEIDIGTAYYVTVDQNSKAKQAEQLFIDWLMTQTINETAEPGT